jgi:molecular chaperone GrpE
MTDKDYETEGQKPEAGEYEVETGDGEDLNEAMREALEAVERSEGEEDEDDSQPDAGPGIAELEMQLAELRERNVRTLADFENYRKRAERERLENRRYEGFSVLVELLPVIDNLGRALQAEGEVDSLKTGVDLILRQFHDLLRRSGVERILAAGQPFDPTVHDAVSREEDSEVTEPTVAEELLPGYRMGDRLLRPASVRVSLPPERPIGGNEDAEPETLH